MRSRVLVTGASGFIAKDFMDYLMNLDSIDFIIGVEREDIEPGFTETPDRIWISKNLDEADVNWWDSIISSHMIDTIFYLESLENINVFETTENLNRRFSASDNIFCEYLRFNEDANDAINLNVVYISTDRIYAQDKFPHELHTLKLTQPELCTLNDIYVQNKAQTEGRILRIQNIVPRIIRPFALTGPGQDLTFPLPKMVNRAIQEAPEDLRDGIPVLENGRRGLTFTHINDLIEFMALDDLFNEETSSTLFSRIINFSKVSNYLYETHLLDKIISKTESLIKNDGNTTEDFYPFIQNTPQIKNLYSVWQPTISIEMILEDIIYELNPVHKYAPLIITDISWTPDSVPITSGTAEPYGVVGIHYPDGTGSITDVDSDGNWAITKDDIQTFEGVWYAHASTASKNQYHTIKILVTPPAS